MLVFLVMISTCTFGQSLQIVYECKLINHTDLPPELHDLKKIIRYSLTISKGVSFLSRDSVMLISKPTKKFSSFCYYDHIYKNYNEDQWVRTSAEFKEGFGVRRKISEINKNGDYQWKIADEKKIIAGAECIKAESPKGHTAWYAPGLPYADGPKFGIFNLPGLVLHYETPYEIWIAKDIYVGHVKVPVPPDGLQMASREDAVRLSYGEVTQLVPQKAVLINNNTPLNTWIITPE